MAERKEIIASLEGARIVVEDQTCFRDEYDFVANQWFNEEVADWPLIRIAALKWVHGWNQLDAFVAIQALVAPGPDATQPQD